MLSRVETVYKRGGGNEIGSVCCVIDQVTSLHVNQAIYIHIEETICDESKHLIMCCVGKVITSRRELNYTISVSNFL